MNMEKDFKNKLTPEQYKIMREKGTERPFTGKYIHENKERYCINSVCLDLKEK